MSYHVRLSSYNKKEKGAEYVNVSLMQKRIAIANHLSTEELFVRYREAAEATERSHFQIMWLLAMGKTGLSDNEALASLLPRGDAKGERASVHLRTTIEFLLTGSRFEALQLLWLVFFPGLLLYWVAFCVRRARYSQPKSHLP